MAWAAPFALTRAAFSGLVTPPSMVMPSARPNCTMARPTPPEAPVTRTVSPARALALAIMEM